MSKVGRDAKSVQEAIDNYLNQSLNNLKNNLNNTQGALAQ